MSTYEDMAGAIFVLFLFGLLLLMVSLAKVLHTTTLSDFAFILCVAWNLPIWQHLWSGLNRMRVHFPDDQSVDQKGSLRGALLND